MTVSAAIAFVQGLSSSAPGFALFGVAGTPVVASNGNNANVTRWVYEFIDVSSLSALVVPSTQDGATPTYTFTPDASGGYLVHLKVFDAFGNFAEDFRTLQVPETSGRSIAPFKGTDLSLNLIIGGHTNLRGWAPFMEAYLRELDALALTASGLDINIDANNVSANVTDTTHNFIVGVRNLSAPRVLTLPAAPSLGQRFSVADKDGSVTGVNTYTINAGANHIATSAQTTFVFILAYESAIFEWTGQIWVLLTHLTGPTDIPAPGTPIGAGATTLGPTNEWNLVQAAGGVITQNSPVAGRIYRYTHVAGGVGSFNLPGGQVELVAGTGGFTIINPQNTLAAPSPSVFFNTDQITYEFILNSGTNVFQCVN